VFSDESCHLPGKKQKLAGEKRLAEPSFYICPQMPKNHE
jgi:hypothetical protein